MIRNSRILKLNLGIIVLTLLAPTWATAQVRTEPTKVNFCDVVASPTQYNGQALSVVVILWPSYHSLSLYGAACVPKEGYDVTTQAILPDTWESQPNGKKLRGILERHRSAIVEVVGIFESGGGRYGPDRARFRFSISEINSVSKHATKRARGAPLTR